jgi:hypothetical protein
MKQMKISRIMNKIEKRKKYIKRKEMKISRTMNKIKNKNKTKIKRTIMY